MSKKTVAFKRKATQFRSKSASTLDLILPTIRAKGQGRTRIFAESAKTDEEGNRVKAFSKGLATEAPCSMPMSPDKAARLKGLVK